MNGCRGFEPLVCGACGAAWFRRGAFLSSDQEPEQVSEWAICLCGSIAPRPPRTLRFGGAEQEVARLVHVLAAQGRWRQEVSAFKTLPDAPIEPTFAKQLAKLERAIELLMRRIIPSPPPISRSR